MLAGVEQVDDLGGLGELGGGDVPDPGGAVAEDGELADVVRAAADALGLHQVPERGGGLEGGDVAGGGPVADRVPRLSSSSWVKKTASLTSRVRARPSSPLPSRPAVSRRSWGRRCRRWRRRACPAAGTAAAGPASGRRSARRGPGRRPRRRRRWPRPPARRAWRSAGPRPGPPAGRAASANGTAAAARSVIAARPGDMDAPRRRARRRGARGRARTARSDTRPASG